MENFLDAIQHLRRKEKVGLALSGGVVLGAAHIGVLQVIEELDIKIDYVAGTSIGAYIGALFAFGKSAKEIKKIVSGVNWLKAAEFSPSRFGLLSSHKFAEMLTGAIGDVDFKDALIPLAVVTTDISTGEKVVLKSGNIAQSVMASTSIPGIFQPLEINGSMLVDGGLVENLPVFTARDMGADIVIGVNLVTGFKKPKNIIDILVNSLHLSIINNTKHHYGERDIILNLQLTDFNRVDTYQVPDLISQGYRQGKSLLKQAAF